MTTFSNYERGQRDLLNKLLALNPEVAAKLAYWHEATPDPEGRLPFDVAFWIGEVAVQMGIKTLEELEEDREADRTGEEGPCARCEGAGFRVVDPDHGGLIPCTCRAGEEG